MMMQDGKRWKSLGVLAALVGLLVIVPLNGDQIVSAQSMPPISERPESAVDTGVWPFSSIGRVIVVLGANRTMSCTGTLVDPQHVLTAAHCLFDGQQQSWVLPKSVRFVSGYAKGQSRVQSVASSFVKGPFRFSDLVDVANSENDWAMIELSQKIDRKPLVIGDSFVGSAPLIRAGYRGDGSYVLNVVFNCHAKGIPGTVLLATDCAAVRGESGSPLLNSRDMSIVGIVVTASKEGTGTTSMVLPAQTIVRH